jgi:hypothetical protein
MDKIDIVTIDKQRIGAEAANFVREAELIFR